MRRRLSLVLIVIGVALVVLLLSRLLPWRPHPAAPDQQFRPGSRLLFVMAHHDDEFTRLVRIRRLREEGYEIHAVWLARDHYGTSLAVGRAESLCAMRSVGVPPSNLHYLPDDLAARPGDYLAQLPLIVEYLQDLIGKLAPAALFLNAYEGGHVEHDAAHAATILAVAREVESYAVYEFPFYNAGGARWPHYQVISLVDRPGRTYSDYPSASELRLLVRGATCFGSQSAHLWGVLAAANLRLLSAGLPFRSVSDIDYTRPPHPGRLNYEGLDWYVALTRALPIVAEMFAPPKGLAFRDFAAAYSAAAERSSSEAAAQQGAAADEPQRTPIDPR
jgi:N-acetylglucosamine malate deacetylase 1